MRPSTALLCLTLLGGCTKEPALARIADPKTTAVTLPETPPGIGFDDLGYSPTLQRVLVPSGRSGRVNLIDPKSLAVTSISGFSTKRDYTGGHDDGPTSVEEARGLLYVTDRTTQALISVDPTTRAIISRVKLAAEPDYVRFVPNTRELWVTEPSADQVEIFKLADDGSASSVATIAVDNGPESLVIDSKRGRAYTHRWQKTTVAIDVSTRALAGEWPNGCEASRGIALDQERGWLISGCNEGTVTVVDVARDGRMLSKLSRGAGFDVIGYSARLGHVYLAGGACKCLVMLGVTKQAELTFLESSSAPPSTHCVTADDIGTVWVCDPDAGRVIRVEDRHPAMFN
jgi:DNA-binding beta-propeller fold protein YncE